MCGIAGAFGSEEAARAAGQDGDRRMVLSHRGPDSFGSWGENGISLLHWRLAIIDLSPAGNQPMLSADGRLVLCYNGEVYNFQQLRAEIEQRWNGTRRWRGRFHTRGIVEGFALSGPDLLRPLEASSC